MFNIRTTKSPEYDVNSFNKKRELNPKFNSERKNKESTKRVALSSLSKIKNTQLSSLFFVCSVVDDPSSTATTLRNE